MALNIRLNVMRLSKLLSERGAYPIGCIKHARIALVKYSRSALIETVIKLKVIQHDLWIGEREGASAMRLYSKNCLDCLVVISGNRRNTICWHAKPREPCKRMLARCVFSNI